MKRTVSCLILIMLSTALATASYGFDGERRAWWKERLAALREERAAAPAGSDLDAKLRALLDRDIRRAEETLAAFDGSGSGAPTVAGERIVSSERLRGLIDEAAAPLFALHSLDLLTARLDGSDVPAATRAAVERRCGELLRAADPSLEADDLRRLVSDYIRADDWRALSYELFMTRLMTERAARLSAMTSAIASDIAGTRSGAITAGTARDLRARIIDRAAAYCVSPAFSAVDDGADGLASSAMMKRLAGRLSRMHRAAPRDDAGVVERPARETLCREIEDEYAGLAARSATTLSYLESLVSAVEAMPEGALRQSLPIMTAVAKKLPALMKRIDRSLSLDPTEQRFLDRTSILRLRGVKRQALEGARRGTGLANMAVAHMARKLAQAASDDKRAERILQERLAQFEVDSLLESMRDHFALYKSLTIADDSFARFKDRFDSMHSHAADGANDPHLECVLQSQSIAASIPEFSKTRIAGERRLKGVIRKSTMLRLAQITQLLRGYAQKRCPVKNALPGDEAADIARALARESAVRIGPWRMDESNFMDVDRKAAALVAAAHNRHAWRSVGTGAGRTAGRVISIPEAGITLTLPASLIERAPLTEEIEKGVIRSFKTPDGKGIVYISRPATRDADPEDVTDLWLSTMGNTSVSDRWGRQDAIDYYWTLSKDRGKQVMETMTVSPNTGTVIIAGVTAKSRYNFFKQHIDALFKSVKF